MGSMIRLSVGRLEIDWGKNFQFADHSQLFQPTDLAQVPYYYVDYDQPQEESDCAISPFALATALLIASLLAS